MFIEELSSKKDEKVWDIFVANNPNATFAHQIAWKKIIEKFYKFESIYLMAKDGKEIKGILPLFLVRNIFLGKCLISVPFSTLGGICTSNAAAEDMLIIKAMELTKNLHCDYLELRNLKEQNSRNLIKKSDYFTFQLQLNSNPESLWKRLRSTNRRYIRRARKNNLQIILDSKDFQKFYNVYSLGQRNLGTPIQAYKWLENLFSEFPNNHSIVMAAYNGKTVAAFFVRYFKNTVTYVFGSSLKEYRHLYPNYILIWELIEDSCRNGYEWLDLGRSVKSSGTYSFKLGWRAEPLKLYYQYYLNKSSRVPDTSQTNPKRQLFASLWKKVPIPVANIFGPHIRKYFP